VPDPDDLSLPQIQAIGRRFDLAGPVRATPVKRHNHVWRLEHDRETFFLKTYTKAWYGDDAAATAFCVAHEVDAWSVLAEHGLPTPEIVHAARDCANPLGRPFVITRALTGQPLTALIAEHTAEPSAVAALLRATGDYLRRMHAITFPYPGYVVAGGPTAPPPDTAWQHRCWTARQRRRDAQAMLRAEGPDLPSFLVRSLEAQFADMETMLATAYQPPRFVHGDCHAHQFFLTRESEDGAWRVTGVLDLEVASAGDPVEDLLKLAVELASLSWPSMCWRWWDAVFAGYGTVPAFEPFRLRLLGMTAPEFGWTGRRATVLERILRSTSWKTLFAPA
jgi:aminoglycoside phosphotransferase (APT) family kinase protein